MALPLVLSQSIARGDIRLGQRWSVRQRVKNDLVFAAATLGLACARRCPHRALVRFGRALGTLASFLLREAYATAEKNVARVMPELDPAQRASMVKGIFRGLGEDLGDTLALLHPEEPAGRGMRLDRASEEALRHALLPGRGVVYVTAHLGPWERMAAYLASLGFPITTMARESYDPRFHAAIYAKLRTQRQVEVIYRGSPSAALAVVRALARGRVVGFPVDLPGRGVALAPVRLLGMRAHLPVGPARIALRRRAPVVVGTPAPDEGGGMRVRIAPIAHDDLDPRQDASAVLLTQRIAEALGERIMALPLRWPWIFPSFETRPMEQEHAVLPEGAVFAGPEGDRVHFDPEG